MKKICLVIILQAGLCTLYAQKNDPVILQKSVPLKAIKEKLQYQEYTITLLPVPPAPRMGKYSFDIVKNNKLVMHQFKNALPFSPKGVQKKEDAYKIAQWMIQEYQKTGHWQNIVPPHIAHELKIQIN